MTAITHPTDDPTDTTESTDAVDVHDEAVADGATGSDAPTEATGPVAGELVSFPVDALVPHPDNPRTSLGDLDELARSIKAHGVLQPLVVLPAGDDGRHLMVTGHRRHAAAIQAKATHVPAVVRDLDPAEVVEAMLIENVNRSALTTSEEVRAIERLMDLNGGKLTPAKLCKRIGRAQGWVRTRMAICALSPQWREAIDRGELSLAAGDAAASVADLGPDHVEALCKRFAGHTWGDHNRLAADHRQRVEGDAAYDQAVAKAKRRKGTAVFTGEDPPDWYLVLAEFLDAECQKAHRGEPCHAVLIERTTYGQGFERTGICTSPDRHAPTTGSDNDSDSDSDSDSDGDGDGRPDGDGGENRNGSDGGPARHVDPEWPEGAGPGVPAPQAQGPPGPHCVRHRGVGQAAGWDQPGPGHPLRAPHARARSWHRGSELRRDHPRHRGPRLRAGRQAALQRGDARGARPGHGRCGPRRRGVPHVPRPRCHPVPGLHGPPDRSGMGTRHLDRRHHRPASPPRPRRAGTGRAGADRRRADGGRGDRRAGQRRRGRRTGHRRHHPRRRVAGRRRRRRSRLRRAARRRPQREPRRGTGPTPPRAISPDSGSLPARAGSLSQGGRPFAASGLRLGADDAYQPSGRQPVCRSRPQVGRVPWPPPAPASSPCGAPARLRRVDPGALRAAAGRPEGRTRTPPREEP
jgi:ParB/RepB/Spo0J family partition protein